MCEQAKVGIAVIYYYTSITKLTKNNSGIGVFTVQIFTGSIQKE